MANFFTGSRGKMKKVKLKTPQQQGLIDQNVNQGIETNPLYQQGSNYLSDILNNDQGSMDRFNAPYLRQFNEQTAPGIAERFAGMGTGASGLSSSGLNDALAQASERLTEHLASMREGMKQNASNSALGYAQQPIQNRNDIINQQHQGYYYQDPSEGLLQPALRTAGQFAGGPGGGALADWGINQFSGGRNSMSGASGRSGGQMPWAVG